MSGETYAERLRAAHPDKWWTAPADQPPPEPNDGRPIWDLVIADFLERDQIGRERYGTPLQVGNGRDALVDAYQEALDLVVYLRQAIEERDTAPEPEEPRQCDACAEAQVQWNHEL